jgi:L-alanine-DL-glutamate epimerase-like enolase superfamily enzyme
MKIANIRSYLLRLPISSDALSTSEPISHRTRWQPQSRRIATSETVVVCIETDNGLVGWGEASAGGSARITRQLVNDKLGPILLGGDAQNIALAVGADVCHRWRII